MIRSFLLALLLASSPVYADEPNVKDIVETHVLPGYRALFETSADLVAEAKTNCSANNPKLLDAYHAAFDAWVSVSHLRFGPSEFEDRAFAIAFWPDPRSATPKALSTLLASQDPTIDDPETFETISIAARGFYALEFLLFEPSFSETPSKDYHCRFVQAVTEDIFRNVLEIRSSWRLGYGDLMTNANNDIYRSETEAAQQFFTAVLTGLEFTADARLGRPMGSFDRPRPKRAEALRSGRSLRHVSLSLTATRELAALISNKNSDVDKAFEFALELTHDLNDPIFSGVSTPQGRLKVEALKNSIETIRRILEQKVGPSLGVAVGFNALDGD